MEPNGERTWIAPSAWAFFVGAVVLLVSLTVSLPSWVRIAGVGLGGALVVYFVFRYAAAVRRGEIRNRRDDEPPGGWSMQGPYTG